MKSKPQHHPEVVDNVNDAVYTTDLRGNFTSVNPAGERLTGYTKEEFTKLNITDVVVPEYMPLVKQKMQEKFKKDIPTVYEVEIKTKDGNLTPIEVSSRALHDDGKPIGVLGVARDISERKLLERQKEIFFSLITHEIKNPLSSIKIFSEMLKKYHEKNDDKKPLHYASVIDDQVDRLTVLVNDFLDISQMNAGKFTLHKEVFDLNQMIAEIVQTFNESSERRRITKIGNGKKSVNADRGRIGQVLTNLLSNAIKYSPPESPISVSIERGKKSVIVKVTNNGDGVPLENRNNIFELFYRLNNHQQDQVKGHGLGLYICKQIIRGHNGEIGVESIDGKSTTFYFSLPLH